MNRRVTFEAAAEAELEAAALYYESEQAGLGKRFMAEVGRVVDRIRSNPEAWQLVTSRSRRCRLARFPYGLVYQIRSSEIVVIAAMHLRRDPGYWHYRES